jgi:hypothetical protein
MASSTPLWSSPRSVSSKCGGERYARFHTGSRSSFNRTAQPTCSLALLVLIPVRRNPSRAGCIDRNDDQRGVSNERSSTGAGRAVGGREDPSAGDQRRGGDEPPSSEASFGVVFRPLAVSLHTALQSWSRLVTRSLLFDGSE